MLKNWQVKNKISKETKNEFPEVNSIILQLMQNRGLVSKKEIDEFMNPDYEHGLHDPFLFRDMEKAILRIEKAAENKEKVLIYGDYDADGVCSSVVLYEIFKKMSFNVEVYLPHREKEGYGLNMGACDYIIKQDVKLVVTVDCGVSNKEEVKKLQEAGIDVIILDHHHPPEELPEAYAIVDAKIKDDKYPFSELAGVGVAFKLVQALVKRGKLKDGQEKWFLDLVALATVADCSDLIGENRALVKWGMVVLNKTKRLGLVELIKAASRKLGKIDTYVIGYHLAPRINAAGRMNHANAAFKLLISDNKSEAERLALDLNRENVERQKLTERILKEANAKIGEFDPKNKLIFVADTREGLWPPGVVGLVAGKLADLYQRPALVVGRNSEGKLIGSGRSVLDFNIIEAVAEAKEYLSHFGGHSGACGFTIKDEASMEPFFIKVGEIAKSKLSDKDLRPVLEIDAEIEMRDITWEFFEQLENFEPFGEMNPKPRFLGKDLEVAGLVGVGNGAKHLRLLVNQGEIKNRKTIGFGFGEWCGKLKVGDKVDIVFEVEADEWNGARELQVRIVDLRASH
ncbi:single-stranded-DNA-specific exonuclease RecJ [Candidatus Falkowbacteria bacterium]|nr:single-stranded-DNA-specific exonuclease RecJ [Candidatus Falkowbacteria bacterium]